MRPTDDLMKEHRVIERMLSVISKAADKLDAGENVDRKLFEDAADFFKTFADKCHHGKEEKLLFVRMINRGASRDEGLIPEMLREHEEGRAHVRIIAELSSKELEDISESNLVKHIRGYVSLLRPHIQKEDKLLFPRANEIFTSQDQSELERGFEEIEENIMGPGVHERYHEMIEEFERRLV